MPVSHRISVAALCLTVVLPAAAAAQTDDPVDSILACRGVAELEARLACFDAAADQLAAARESGGIMTVTRDDVEAVERDSFGFRMPSLPRLRMPLVGAMAARHREHEALADSPSASVTPDAATPAANTATAAPATAATAAPADNAAAEEADVAVLERAENGDVFRVSMEIVRTRTVGYNTTLFYMANGQVWRQTDSNRVRLPSGDDPIMAEIRRAALDSYLLRINGTGRAIRVRRER